MPSALFRCDSIDREVIWNKAQVVKLVDTLASGASALAGVEVQVLSWAPIYLRQLDFTLRPSRHYGGTTASHSLSRSALELYLQLFAYYPQQH